ncbi:unnamed protein product [Paramecium octaurelia]|uniref:Uncharacterized protein n=1 Tax=Paramecium octaurelia TaxID=43137 RepID=A0A8S1TFL2_PAROT|nr:unnamed protein product [Paramecium octaurelia]
MFQNQIILPQNLGQSIQLLLKISINSDSLVQEKALRRVILLIIMLNKPSQLFQDQRAEFYQDKLI